MSDYKEFLTNYENGNVFSVSFLDRHKEDIMNMFNERVKQTVIIKYLFSIDEEIKEKYDNEKGFKNIKVLMSQFIKKNKVKRTKINRIN